MTEAVVEPVKSETPPVEGAAPVVPPVVAERPTGLADDYWDTETSAVRWDKVNEKLAATAPAAPELPADAIPFDSADKIPWDEISVTDGENAYAIDKDDPFVERMGKHFIDLKVPAAAVKAMTREFLQNQVEEGKRVRDLLAAESAKLGDSREKIDARLNAAEAFVTDVLTGGDAANTEKAAKAAKEFRNSWITASQVEIVEAMMKRVAGPAASVANATDPNAGLSVGQSYFAGMKKRA